MIEAENAKTAEDFSEIGSKIQNISKDIEPRLANETAVLSETLPAFAYKLISDKKSTIEHIKSCQDSAEYYLNRVRSDARKLGKELEWPNAVANIFPVLLALMESGPSQNCPQTANIKPTTSNMNEKGQKPKVSLEGNRWIVEQGNSYDGVVEVNPESMNQSVMIENCEKINVRISGKVSAVAINRCKRLKLEVGDVVSSIEATSTMNSELFLRGKAPTVTLDSSEGIRLHLSELSRETQVLSSKCAEINLTIPQKLLASAHTDESADDVIEIALPFQFKSVLTADGTIVTEAVKHSGA